jgi:hypothetical protein
MSKRNLLNLALLIFILILVTVVVYEPGKEKTITPLTLTNLKNDDIQHIKINRRIADKNEQDVIFEKTAEGWMMLKPYQLTANTFRIDSILKLLSAVSLSQNNLEDLDQNKFGLSIPQATITFNKTKIIFGHNKSLNNHRYVKIDSTLHMVADSFYYQLMAKTESFINHKLLPEKSKITKLHLPHIKFEQTDGKWDITPKADDFSADSVNQLISEWQLSQAYDINKVKTEEKTKADITIHLSSNKIIRFKIEKNKDNFNLVNLDSGVRYILSADRKDKLLKLSDLEKSD